MNLSNLLSISFFDEENNQLSVHTTLQKPIEFFISRDINYVIPSMFMQNVTSLSVNSSINNRQFNLHFNNITQTNPNMSISVHLEMHPLDNTLAYMLIYKFDSIPQLNSSINQIDGWSILCPKSDDLSTYFIDNNKTSGHQLIIYGIRELNTTEFQLYCRNKSNQILITDRSFNFSSNYELRIYTSGCYYLDSDYNWQSNGLLVSDIIYIEV